MKCIYLRTNLINGKQYVGQTIDFEERERDWKYAVNGNLNKEGNHKLKGYEWFKGIL